MLKYINRNWTKLTLEIIIDFARALTALVLSFQMGTMTNGAVDGDIHGVVMSSIYCLVCLVLMYMFQVAEVNLRKRVTGNAIVGLKAELYKSIGQDDINTFRVNSESYYLNLMQSDIDTLERDYFDALCKIFNYLIQVTVAILGLLYLSPKLFIIFTILSLPPQIISRLSKGVIQKSKQEYSLQNEKTLLREKEFISGFATIRAFSKIDSFINRMLVEDSKLEEKRRKRDTTNISASAGATSVNMIAQIICMAVAAYFVATGEFRFGALTSSTQLLNFIFNPLNLIINGIINVSSTKGLRDKYLELTQNNDGFGTEDFVNGNITFDNISVGYAGDIVFKNFSTTFEHGKKYAVIGKSGAGKSTLLKALVRSAELTAGSIKIAGENLQQYSCNVLYKNILYVPQKTILFEGTVADNISFFEDKKDVSDVAEIACLSSELLLSEAGGDRGEQLSGGEKTRIAIARALLTTAPIIIFDEPTSGLDPKTAKQIEDVIMNIKNKTIIVVTHNWEEEYLAKFDGVVEVG